MMNGATEHLAVNDQEASGKERDDDEDDDDDVHDADDDADVADQSQQLDAGHTAEWTGVSFASLPEWLQDNELIETGHRPQLDNFHACLQSVFSVHSETGNIWTHLIGHHHHHLLLLCDCYLSATA